MAEILDYKNNGYFVDIGAYDGINLSNSYFLEKELNWNGICVEANSELYDKLKNSRQVLCENCAVNSYNGTCFFNPQDLSGSVKTEGTAVISKTLESIFDEYSAPKIIDYLSLDVEGLEYEILKVFPFNKYYFRTITVEHNLYIHGPAMKLQLQNLLKSNGYLIAKENVADQGNEFEDWYIYPPLIRSEYVEKLEAISKIAF